MRLPEWYPDESDVLEPDTSQKEAGYADDDQPKARNFNYFLKRAYECLRWLDGFVTVGSSDLDDYANINDAVSAGKTKIILTSNITTTVQQIFSLSSGIIRFNGYKIIGSSAIAGAIFLVSGNDNHLEDPYTQGTHTTGTTTDGIKLSGHRNHIKGQAITEQNGAGGTITNGINATGNNNQGDGLTRAIAGTLTNGKVDSGTDNDLRIVEV